MHESLPEPATAPRTSRGPVFAVVLLSAFALLLLVVLFLRYARNVNSVALSSAPKPVTYIEAVSGKYRPNRTYVATVEPWASAKVGPQLVSAYVDTVLVRPGAVVKKGDVLATLDCRGTSAQSQAVAMQARALDARQKAAQSEASRMDTLAGKGFVSENEAEQKAAQSSAEQASLLAARAKLMGSSLEVNDCILRAPFDGEVAARLVDPGAYVRPGTAIIELVDRSTVRITGEAPEVDVNVVAVGVKTNVALVSTKKEFAAAIARRSPAADPQTRTIHFEIDFADAEKSIAVGTTAEVRVEVGEAQNVTEVPLVAASVKGTKASLFVVEGDIVRSATFAVKGEGQGKLYLATDLKPGTRVITEGRAILNDGDRVQGKLAEIRPAVASPSASTSSTAKGK
jgi:RND family efflux transporter MFP subunit